MRVLSKLLFPPRRGNVVFHMPNWIRRSSPSGYDDDDGNSSNSHFDHQLQQNDVPPENSTVHDPSVKEQEERTKPSSEGKSLISGSEGPWWSIISKLKKWNPRNCCGFAAKG